MGTIRRYRGFAAWLAVFALLANVVAAAICHPPSSGLKPPADYPVELLGAFVICSGAHDASADDNGKAPDSPTKPCQICITVAALGFAIALAVIALLFPPVPQPRRAFSFAATFAELFRRGSLGSRAPPLHA
jgi:hypothetical protein